MPGERVTIPLGRPGALRGTPQQAHASGDHPTSDPFTDPNAAAVPRLTALAGVFAFMTVIMLTINTLIHFGVLSMPVALDTSVTYLAMGIGFSAAMAMCAISRSQRSAEQILAYGLGFQVIGGLCISFAEQQQYRPGVPIVCIWILTFTMLPVSPARAAAGSYATALTVPVAMLAHAMLGHRPMPTAGVEWVGVFGAFASAMISTFITKVMHGMTRQVEHARRLGAYELIEELGHGGMGEVWRAAHHSLIRPAAVKLLRRELTHRLPAAERDALNLRFQREVQSTALLSSP
ncbi:MAG TPA: hypothetical protein VK427_00280, partial [Kofleriaceae bacterium]|nr:hypothetical protein [Kofleriaceae bacterium]